MHVARLKHIFCLFLHLQPPRRINARETYRAMLYVADDTSYFRDFCDIYLLIWRSPQHTV